MNKNSFVFDEPIVVIGLPRSGTSLVTGLLAKHGVFTGSCKPADEKNKKGFYEHIGFTELMVSYYGKGFISKGQSVNPMPGFRDKLLELIQNDGYNGGPWLIKHATVYHKLWEEFRPRFVLVRRSSEGIYSSVKAVGWKAGPQAITFGQVVLDELAKLPSAVEVHSNKIVAGEHDELYATFKHCGLELDMSKVEAFVDKKLWKHGQ